MTTPRFVHLAVEATKQAFAVRERYITDPAYMAVEAQGFLDRAAISCAWPRSISHDRAAAWPPLPGPGDTVWMGVIDDAGRAVSCIQSIYHEFGSGVVLGESGINWQNRGVSFSLDQHALNGLIPGRKPFHTLNPALAQLHDGRTVVYGTMGGDGQPQTQAAIFSRYVNFGLDPQAAIDAPRWRLGRAWGQDSRYPQARVALSRCDDCPVARSRPSDRTAAATTTNPWAMPAWWYAMPTAASKAAPIRDRTVAWRRSERLARRAAQSAVQFTAPSTPFASTTMPKAMRYQAKNVKSCELM